MMAEMEVPGAGSLSSLASNMEVSKEETPEGESAEFLVFEVSR